jgi:TPR repeat protein
MTIGPFHFSSSRLARSVFIASVTALPVLSFSLPASAQRWTPLTGVLPDDEDAGKPPAARSEPTVQETETGSLAKSRIATAKRSFAVTLSRSVTNGQPHGGLGVRLMPVDADLASGLGLGGSRGVMVTDAGSATGSGDKLQAGDVIQKADGRAVDDVDSLLRQLRDTSPNQKMTLDIWRAGEGPADLRQFLVDRSNGGNVGASASLGRMMSLGLVVGPKNNAEAARYYLKAAEAGHLASMTRYALFAKDGIGISKNEAMAATWFRKAANGGQEAAMTNLGGLYEAGRGVKQDYVEAARWYQRGVDNGHVFAMHRLALLYEAGRGVTKNDQEAVRLLQLASDGGLSEATSWLADKYEQGRGIPKDEYKAYELNARAADQVRKTADQGNAVATFNLGILYRIGKGVKKSDTEAAYWVVKSLRLGDKYLVAELIRNPNVLSLADRKWMQEVLRDEGTYKGPINGTFTPEVRTAMEALANPA